MESEGYDGRLTLDKIAVLGRNRFVFNNLIEKLNEDSELNNKCTGQTIKSK